MALSLLPLLGKSGGDDLFLSSCYHDGETLTDLQIPQGVIFLTASNPVFLFLNITYRSNRKQVWGWNTTLTHLRISPLSQWCIIWCQSNELKAISKLYHDLQWSLSDVSIQVQKGWKWLLIVDLFLLCLQLLNEGVIERHILTSVPIMFTMPVGFFSFHQKQMTSYFSKPEQLSGWFSYMAHANSP